MTRIIRIARLSDVLRDPRKPPRAKPVDHEGPVQTAILAMIADEFPDVTAYSTLNGARLRPKVKAKMKREGLRAGIVDLHLDWPGDDGWIEVKAPRYRPSDVTDEQRAFIASKQAKGRNAGIASSPDEARALLLAWGAPRRERAA